MTSISEKLSGLRRKEGHSFLLPLALLSSLVPLIAVHGAHYLSSATGDVPWCLAYFEGCTSVSRAARHSHAIGFFRILMYPYIIFLILFWSECYRWLLSLGADAKWTKMMRWLGILGALLLVAYITFLDASPTHLKLLKRLGVIFYFAFTIMAGMLFIAALEKSEAFKHSRIIKSARNALLALCVIEIGFGIAQILVSLLLTDRYAANNVIEWNVAFLMHFFFLIVAFTYIRYGRGEGRFAGRVENI